MEATIRSGEGLESELPLTSPSRISPEESRAPRGESLESALKSFWEKNEGILRGIAANPPIFYHSYPNVDPEIASFNTPAKAVPSLLHHHVESSKLTRVDELVEYLKSANNKHCIFLVGGKGCGKTRALYELLSQSFGFYFRASRGEGGGESGDLQAIIDSLKLTHTKVSELAGPRRIAGDAMLCAVVARLLIFAKLLEIKPGLTPVEWLVCQTECRPRDLFRELTLFLVKHAFHSRCLESAFAEVIGEVHGRVSEGLGCGKLLFILDEAQSEVKNKYQADSKSEKLRSLVSQALRAFRTNSSAPIACILAGTGTELLMAAQEMEFREPEFSFELSCPSPTYEGPDGFEAFSRYLSGFLGPCEDYRILFEKYYRSRAGLISAALHHYINRRIPRQESLRFLEEFGASFATRPGAEFATPGSSVFDTLAKVGSDRFLFSLMRDVTEAFYLGGRGYFFSHSTSIKLVELGLAVLKLPPCETSVQEVATREASLNRHSVPWEFGVSALITEKIVQAALAQFFVDKVKVEIVERYTGVQTDGERAAYFEKHCPVFILDLFSRGMPLENLFSPEELEGEEELIPEPAPEPNRNAFRNDLRRNFHEKNEKNDRKREKQHEEICYVEHSKCPEAASLTKEVLKLESPSIGTPLMVKLGQSWSLERWLNEGRRRPTFLQTKTENQFGPDLIAMLQVPGRNKELLLSVQVRPGMAPDRLDPRLFFAHNKAGEVAERNRENSSLLSEYWSGGWVELLISPCRRLQRDSRPFPGDKPCIRASIDAGNVYRMFPKLLDHIKRR